jgi:hypothetical protein
MSAQASLRESGAGRSDSAELQVIALQAHDTARWDEFVRSHPEGTFFHLAGWQQVLERAFGHRTHYLLVESGRAIRGVLPLAEVKSLLFGHALVSTPFCVYGGILASDDAARRALEERACELARNLQVDHLEMRNRRRQHPQWPCKDLYVTFRKQIIPESEANMQAIPRKQRAVIRKALQRGLSSEIDNSVERHYALYSESLRNLGTPVFARRYLEILQEVFAADCEITVVVDRLQPDSPKPASQQPAPAGAARGRPLAAVLSFIFRDEILPYYGGGSAAARGTGANDFMYWEVMERARQRGLRRFDYGRSKRGTGSFDFKVHWGFEPEPLCYEYYLVRAREVPNLSPTNAKYAGFISLWRRLPLYVTRLFGPALARFLG